MYYNLNIWPIEWCAQEKYKPQKKMWCEKPVHVGKQTSKLYKVNEENWQNFIFLLIFANNIFLNLQSYMYFLQFWSEILPMCSYTNNSLKH